MNACESEREQSRIIWRQFCGARPVGAIFRGALEKVRTAGAIILGKTTLSEFASGDTYGSMFGVTRNPYDLDRTVGGSSGGSGAALAANFSTLTIGEETGASLRRPGAWNEVAALRPKAAGAAAYGRPPRARLRRVRRGEIEVVG